MNFSFIASITLLSSVFVGLSDVSFSYQQVPSRSARAATHTSTSPRAKLMSSARANQPTTYGTRAKSSIAQSQVWEASLRQSIMTFNSSGAGGYSVRDDAHEALAGSFDIDARLLVPRFAVNKLRPTFCSGAVYACVLNALIIREKFLVRNGYGRQISLQAWKSLFPLRYKDGERAWGWANANGPGFAVLVHTLGAGVNFTDWNKAQAYDIIKMWWTREIGAKERGHLAILLEVTPTHVRYWSSNKASEQGAAGFGIKTVAREKIKRVLFSRITRPEAFNKAPSIGQSEWLLGLLSKPSTWEECMRHSGVAR